MANNKITVKDFLTKMIEASGLKQVEIADRIGYEKPNMITMLKQGKTRVPPNKVPLLANALGIDKLHFLRIVMQEYHPEIWEVVEECLESQLITDDEMEYVRIIRDQAGGRPITLQNDEERAELRGVVEKIASRNFQRAST